MMKETQPNDDIDGRHARPLGREEEIENKIRGAARSLWQRRTTMMVQNPRYEDVALHITEM